VDRGKRGIKRSTVVDGRGIPFGVVTAPANRHDDSPLLDETLDHALRTLGELPDGASVHLDRDYDSLTTRRKLEACSLIGEISQKGKPAS
jgi:IS5 family transposase